MTGENKNPRTGRILIVDDEPDIALLLKMALEHDGSFGIVRTFDDPTLALFDFKAGLYDFVILDLTMPHIDGFDLYQQMRKIDSKVKFCFLSGRETCGDEPSNGYHSLRDDMFIKKPITITNFLKEVHKRLG
ncbi:MAG TPA: response regulator [Nitrososphaeraceae archaeon]|nr:response regulator [Nitrososphaeraceae archaeon]